MKSLLILLLAAAARLHAEAVVTNVRAAQVPGTHQVRVTYDLTAAAACTVSVQASLDGGASYPIGIDSAALLTGAPADLGAAVQPGTGKSLTVDAPKLDPFQNQFTKNLRFKITATENSGPPAYGDMVLIPAGNFQMGDQSSPLVGFSDELPVRTVFVSAFYMAKHETTKELWDSVRAWGLTHSYTDLAAGNGSYASKGANHPVHSITWYDMVKWCNARSEMENLVPCYTVSGGTCRTGQNSAVACNWSANGYRLPTEAEWEKAARGGQSGQNFPWGNTITHSLANYYSSSTYSYDVSPTRGHHPTYAVGGDPYTAPVDSFTPNAYGLFNMSGNVWEWCWDWYSSSYYASSPGTDPRGSASGSYRVDRGGSWVNVAYHCRTAFRGNGSPTGSSHGIGFRPARSSVP